MCFLGVLVPPRSLLPNSLSLADKLTGSTQMAGERSSYCDLHQHLYRLLISGLTLQTNELKDAIARRTTLGTICLHLTVIDGITPTLAWGARSLPLNPDGSATGLAIFCHFPTSSPPRPKLIKVPDGKKAPVCQ